MKRKFLSIALVLILVLSFTACGDSSSASKPVDGIVFSQTVDDDGNPIDPSSTLSTGDVYITLTVTGTLATSTVTETVYSVAGEKEEVYGSNTFGVEPEWTQVMSQAKFADKGTYKFVYTGTEDPENPVMLGEGEVVIE